MASRPVSAGDHAGLAARHALRIEPGGWRVEVGAGRTLLEAALEAGIDMPRSCRNGTCRTCLCRMLSGDVAYRVEWPGLSFDEKEEGWVLPCVAVPTADVVLEAPLARPLAPGDEAGRR